MKTQWQVGRFNYNRLHISPMFEVVVRWEKDGFQVSFNHIPLKTKFESLEEAKKAGIDYARTMLIRALQNMDQNQRSSK